MNCVNLNTIYNGIHPSSSEYTSSSNFKLASLSPTSSGAAAP
ncbi:unnamed protein product [Protopolystoma xenopodis]|uniref:Uncharacterized protein n=1 Tax=Protopolystoma xenopodis TaxID=117903 RepID=A0A448WX77_9PLAT|nr:unnamed protein product [Protopolystoma xenopodis]